MADNYPDIFDRPIPGQSLTDEPKNYPWEHPAQFSDLREARDRIFEGLTQEESVQQLYTMLRSNVPVEAIVIYCITSVLLPVSPPENTPLVPEDMFPFPICLTVFVKSPKSVPFPADAIVTYSI